MYFFDKSKLSIEIQERQKLKGTYDSPCMSVCNYEGPENICQTCKMKKEEKIKWISADSEQKEELINDILKRKKS